LSGLAIGLEAPQRPWQAWSRAHRRGGGTYTFVQELIVPDGDVLVHAGDLCRAGTLDELAGTAAWLAALPHRHKIVVAGNHDGWFLEDRAAARATLGAAHYLEDATVVLDGVRFYGSPWQPAYND